MTARDRWMSLCEDANADGDIHAAFDLLALLHEVPHRAYHNLVHVIDVLDALDELTTAQPPVDARLAIWFHDAVYVPGFAENEAASAKLCAAYALGLGFADRVTSAAVQSILATAHDATPPSASAATVVDADLAILGASEERYDAYASAIRREWGHVPTTDFNAARVDVLRRFLARSSIYTTERGRELFEEAAQANLSREISTLEAEA